MTLLYDSNGKRESDETLLKLLSAGTNKLMLKQLLSKSYISTEEALEAERRVAELRESFGVGKPKVMRWRRHGEEEDISKTVDKLSIGGPK